MSQDTKPSGSKAWPPGIGFILLLLVIWVNRPQYPWSKDVSAKDSQEKAAAEWAKAVKFPKPPPTNPMSVRKEIPSNGKSESADDLSKWAAKQKRLVDGKARPPSTFDDTDVHKTAAWVDSVVAEVSRSGANPLERLSF